MQNFQASQVNHQNINPNPNSNSKQNFKEANNSTKNITVDDIHQATENSIINLPAVNENQYKDLVMNIQEVSKGESGMQTDHLGRQLDHV